jgi:glutamate formiminotransferase/formiminotetrahydrofolate cyclodeaminase
MRVTGSELIGMIPLRCLLEAGRYYLEQQSETITEDERELIHLAQKSLGLSEISPFIPEERIIEYKLAVVNPRYIRTDVTNS